MESLPSYFQIADYMFVKEDVDLLKGEIHRYFKPEDIKPPRCKRCSTPLGKIRSRHPLKLRCLDVMGLRVWIHVFRRKGSCKKCKKVRSEKIHFVSDYSPHQTKMLSDMLFKLCEIAAVSRAARFSGFDKSTLQRLDFNTLKTLLDHYDIPPTQAISVDEVYATRKRKEGQSRDDQFLTIITDLNTHKVIWIEPSRRGTALKRFFDKIGKKRTKEIKVVACDQHPGYRRALEKYCPAATIVWDRFHIIQNMNVALNDCRKLFIKMIPKSKTPAKLRGKYRFIFLKRDSKRNAQERKHIEKVQKDNNLFIQLELIKERMYSFFEAESLEEGKEIFKEIGTWVLELGFPPLKKWYKTLSSKTHILFNYFDYRVTTAVSEGINNVIKSLKRQAFGYRVLEYFKLKILQRCGYLNTENQCVIQIRAPFTPIIE